MRALIEEAIRGKRLVQLDYGGGSRLIEPHVVGTKDGKPGILAYQLEGYSSSGGLPQWRRMYFAEITNVKVLDRTFAGRRSFPSGKHSDWDVTHLVVGA